MPASPSTCPPGDPLPTDLHCHRCGYDLRAQVADGVCPECGTAVAESRRMAAFPLRPTWAASDPRWRRRVLAGLWLLAMLPVLGLAKAGGWLDAVPVPTVVDYRGTVRTLGDTFLFNSSAWQPLAFCVGVGLLFAADQGRRPGRVGWPRRMGVVCVYATLLIAASAVMFLVALVLVGIGALFLSMPAREQPWVVPWVVGVGTGYLRHGPQPGPAAYLVQVGFASAAVLLACVPLYDAMRRAAPRWVAATLVLPLAAFAGVHLGQAGWESISPGGGVVRVAQYETYFRPNVIVGQVYDVPLWGTPLGAADLAEEELKWGAVAVMAVWLSVAQTVAWRGRRKQASKDGRGPVSGEVVQGAGSPSIPTW